MRGNCCKLGTVIIIHLEEITKAEGRYQTASEKGDDTKYAELNLLTAFLFAKC
jgi:hypothetical protein